MSKRYAGVGATTSPRMTLSQVRRLTKAKPESQIRKIRENSGLTLRAVCEHAGVSPATLCRVEDGKAPDITTALRLAAFYETTVEVLFNSFK